MRNVLKNIVTGIALAAAGMTVATAQEFTFGVGAQVQLSALDAVGVAETSDLGYGGGGGLMLDLGLQLGDHWSIHTGAGYSLFKTRLELDRPVRQRRCDGRRGRGLHLQLCAGQLCRAPGVRRGEHTAAPAVRGQWHYQVLRAGWRELQHPAGPDPAGQRGQAGDLWLLPALQRDAHRAGL